MKTRIIPGWRRCAFSLVAAAAALSLASGTAPAQVGTTSPDLALDDPATYERAAEILVGEALLLPDVDSRKSVKLQTAARLYDAARRPEKARTTMLHAGLAAYHAGQHATAAHIFLDASDPSLNRGVRDGRKSAITRAAWVLRNGEFTRDEKKSILQRARRLEGVDVEDLTLEDMSSER